MTDVPFPYDDYDAAKATLLAALGGAPFYALVLGDSGTGKTCLAREMRAALDRPRHHLVYVASSRASVTGIVRLLALSLHLRPRRAYLETVHALAQIAAAQTARLLLWLDDADQIPTPTLAELRTLIETDPAAPLCSVVLAGAPPLASRLESPKLFALARRLTWRSTLTGLRRDELEPFLLHRFGALRTAELPTSIFDELFERTRALPALLDRVIRHLPPGAVHEDQVRAALDRARL